jgi:hypothetical protein
MKQFLIALDQVVNTLVWARGEGFGRADETLSARMYRLRERPGWGAAMAVTDAVFGVFGDPDHCRGSWEAECRRQQLPGSYQECETDEVAGG